MWVGPSAVAIGAALVCLAAAVDVAEAVHLFAEGSALHEQQRGRRGSQHPSWKNVIAVRSVEEFTTTLRNEPLALVFFYTPWSDSSHRFYKSLEETVAGPLKAMRPSIPVAAVDVNEVPDLGREYRIQTLPTFAAFRHGTIASAAENQFPRHADGVMKHMRRLLEPAFERVDTVEHLHRIVNATWPHQPIVAPREKSRHPDDATERTVVVGHIDDPAQLGEFEGAARFVGGYFRMIVVPDSSVARAVNAKMGTIVVYRRWCEEEPLVLPASQSKSMINIARHLVYHGVAPMGEFTEDTRFIYAQRHKPLLAYFSPARLPATDPLFSTLSALMCDEALNITAAQVNPNLAGRTVARFLGFDASSYGHQSWSIGLLVGRKKYRFDNTLPPTADNLRKFVMDGVTGAIPEYHRSEGRSVVRPPGEVSDLTYQDFQSDVLDDSTRDALILVYHPNNRACRELLPIIDDVATKLQGVSGILVARFNAQDNDYHDGYATPGYPSILYARRDKKATPVRYTGVGRSTENVLEFVAENAAVSLSSLAPSNQTPSANRKSVSDTPISEDL